MNRNEMIEAMADWMDYVNNHWGQDYGYSKIQSDHEEWFDENGEVLEEFEHEVFYELDWSPYILQEAEAMFNEGYRLVSTGKDCVAGLFVDKYAAGYTLKFIA